MDDHEVILYQKADGSVPVRDLILGLPHGMREKAVHDLELLQQYGPRLREPHSKLIGDGIFELRIRFANDIARVSSFFLCGKEDHRDEWLCEEDAKDASQRMEACARL